MRHQELVRDVGNWVEGDRFFDRELELANLIEHLDEGAHLSIIAQRRIGKTSLMREAGRQLQGRFACLQVDLQKCQDAADAITELAAASRSHLGLWERTKRVFRNMWVDTTQRIEELSLHELKIKLRDGLAADWQAKGEELLSGLAEADRPVAIFVDEVPILINRLLKGDDYKITPERRRAADAFLSWLRAMSMAHKGKIRLVITGSIGLEPILRQAGLSATVNTFTPFDLGPWSDEVASECLAALARQYQVNYGQGAREGMIQHLGSCVPHHVQLFFSYVYEDCKRRKSRECAREDVDRVYRTVMLSNRGHAELSHFEERLKMVLGPELTPLALDFLTEAAVAGSLTPEAAAILAHSNGLEDVAGRESTREILGILEHDGYLKRPVREYVFVSRLLREWWKARFGFAYIEVVNRGL